MRRPSPLFYNVLLFVVAQSAWFLLLGLWIYWYVKNYFLLNLVQPDEISETTNIIALVSGLTLLVVLSVILSLIFIYLNRQLNINRLYDTFIANVTHELKSPLSSIQLYLETMKKRDVPSQKSKEFISLMLNDVERLNNLINSILYLSALEQTKMAKKMAHDYHVYEANEIIRSVLKDTIKQFNLTENSVQIVGTANGKCVADRFWLKIVFDNLTDNAIKYSKNPLAIKITLSSSPKYIIISFSDNGIGISKRNLNKIFMKFQRIQNPQTPSVKGTGLGLFWVKEIVEYHGGSISVESPGLDQGSTFIIHLPIYQALKTKYINRLLKLSKKPNPEGDL
jgi:signal transduction histidine kinase